jgi:hypothetical protein
MHKSIIRFFVVIFLMFGASFVVIAYQAEANFPGQIPTVSVPTVTSSPSGSMATVTREFDQINVRGGPGAEYPLVGVLIAGQQIPALGRSAGGLWVEIAYPGAPDGVAWVYSPYVEVVGSLPIVEPPPTPTPRTTPTVDPTLAAQFIVEIPATRLPTYTVPPPLAVPTFPPEQLFAGSSGVPAGLVIIGLGSIGIFGLALSLLRGR